MEAGKLRYRIDIEKQLESQDETTGEVTVRWTKLFTNVPASIKPLSVRGYLAAQQVQAEVATEIQLRYRPGITAKMRVRHGKMIYAIIGPPLPDANNMRTHLTLMCGTGVSDGK